MLFLIKVCRLAGAMLSRERRFAPTKVRYNVSTYGRAAQRGALWCVSPQCYVVMCVASSKSARSLDRAEEEGRVDGSWVTSRSI